MHSQMQKKCDRLFLLANAGGIGLNLRFTDAGIDDENYFGSITLKPERAVADGHALVSIIETRLHLKMPSAVMPLDGFTLTPLGERTVRLGRGKLQMPQWLVSSNLYPDVRYWPLYPPPNVSGIGPYSIAYGEYDKAREVFTFFVTLTAHPVPMPPRLHEAHKGISNRIAESFLFNVRHVSI